ncbi:MAG: hypothetical protein CMC04_07695 [Flavobacteriaceae bacterium]|nr:hypothetical protein [Flavobacteriaceae bacterium]|tara:strand:+ start:16758 stop:17144 length:387 start_codon:yes stop_codon:yes gene_type:complete
MNNVKLNKLNKLNDSRGSFIKIINGEEIKNPFACEVYITTAKPGQSKGGHFHNRAHEWFYLIKGFVELTTVNVDSGEKEVLLIKENSDELIYMPPRIAHSFKNIGKDDFILLAYTDVTYDPSDTIAYE